MSWAPKENIGTKEKEVKKKCEPENSMKDEKELKP